MQQSRSLNVVFAVLACAYFFVGATSLSVVGLLPEMSAAFKASPASIAQLVTVHAVVYAVAAPGLQAIVGGLQRRWLIAGGLVLVAASCFATAFAASYWVLVATRIGMGIGCALIGPTASAAAAALVPPDRRPAALAAVFTGLTVSTVLGVPLASYLGQTIGWQWAWGVLGLASLAVLPALLAVLHSDNQGARATFSAFLGVLSDRGLSLGISTTALQLCAQFVTYALIAAWMVERVGISPAIVPISLFLFGIGGVFGNAMAPIVERRLGAERTVMACLFVMAATLAFMWQMPQSTSLALAAMFIWSCSGLMVMAPLQGRLVRLSPERASLSLALNASAIYVGMSIGAAVSGAVYTALGASVLPIVSVAVIAIAAMVFRASLVR